MWPFKKAKPKPKASIYYPVDCSWPSTESVAILNQARKKYNEFVERKVEYVALIASNHWTTQGYWIDFDKKDLTHHPLDYIIHEHSEDTQQDH